MHAPLLFLLPNALNTAHARRIYTLNRRTRHPLSIRRGFMPPASATDASIKFHFPAFVLGITQIHFHAAQRQQCASPPPVPARTSRMTLFHRLDRVEPKAFSSSPAFRFSCVQYWPPSLARDQQPDPDRLSRSPLPHRIFRLLVFGVLFVIGLLFDAARNLRHFFLISVHGRILQFFCKSSCSLQMLYFYQSWVSMQYRICRIENYSSVYNILHSEFCILFICLFLRGNNWR